MYITYLEIQDLDLNLSLKSRKYHKTFPGLKALGLILEDIFAAHENKFLCT